MVDGVQYTDQTADISYGRSVDGAGEWVRFNNPTPNMSNVSSTEPTTGIYINEFIARNSSVHQNNIGLFDDWIELYNDNNEAIDIGGLYITDRESDLGYWQIPTRDQDSTTIPAKGFYMIYPSGDPDLGIQHTNFQLAGSGEYIGLSENRLGSFEIIDEITYPAQSTNISYGRERDGTASWISFETPTPLRSNQTSSVEDRDMLFKQGLWVYPNPAVHEFTIRFEMEKPERVELDIYNLYGVLIHRKEFARGVLVPGQVEKVISVRDTGLKQGNFIIQVRIGDRIKICKLAVL